MRGRSEPQVFRLIDLLHLIQLTLWFVCRQQTHETVARLESDKTQLSEKLQRAEHGLRSCIPRHIYQGIQSVERLVQEHRVRGYHGPVYELITLKDPKFAQAVEVREGAMTFY
jgi:chromosome segregation ATPase